MGDRVATFTIGVGGDDADIRQILAGVKSQFRSAVSEIESISKKVTLFEGLETKTKASADALATATANATKLQAQFDAVGRSGAKATDDLVKGLKEANSEVSKATTEYNRNVDSISKMQSALARAGVDTKNLAAEQTRLATASRLAADAAAVQASQQMLGLKTLKDVAPEIQRLNAAYNTLSVSGKLSVKELAQAQQLLKERVAEVRSQVTGTAEAAKAGGFDLASFFTRSLLPALGLTASLATVFAAIKGVITAGNEYQNAIARIGVVTQVTQADLQGLGKDVRQLATEFGFDLKEGLQGVIDLLRSGVPRENVIDVLRISAEAANAQVTSIGTATKVANALISGFGVTVGQLSGYMDVLSASTSRGGANFDEWAASGGAVLNVARAAKVPFEELVAAETLMVNAGLEAGQAFSELGRIIQKLQTEPVRQRLQALGIVSNDLVEILTELGRRNIGLDNLLELGLAGTKSAQGIAALTNNVKDLPGLLRDLGNAAGDAKTKADALFDTPEERQKRFNAAWHETTIALSETFGTGSKVAEVLTDIMNRAAESRAGFAAYSDEVKSGTRAWYDFLTPLKDARAETEKITAAQAQAKATQDQYKIALDSLAASATNAKTQMRGLTDELIANIKALQESAARNIVDINTAANEEIAALDRRVAATKATADAILAIQTKQAADVFAVIQASEKQITVALEAEIKAREEMERRQGINAAKIAQESAKARLEAMAPVLAQYRALYDALIVQEQGYKAKSEALQNDRLAFNQSIEGKLFNLRLQGLAPFDQYLETVRRVESLAAQAREAGAQGDVKRAKEYIDQALALTDTIKAAVGSTGAVLISADQAQQKRLELIKRLAAGYNETLSDAGTAAEEGAKKTEDALAEVRTAMVLTEVRYNRMKLLVEEGLDIKVNSDLTSFANVKRDLDALTADREVVIRVREERTATGEGTTGTTGGFAQGGFVQAFANGGSVFRRLLGAKVPGSGDGDTVPAALTAGSFVVRKAASQKYGDGIMSTLARFFAGGGPVQNFAVGGMGVFKPGAIADTFFSNSKLGAGFFGSGAPSAGSAEVHALKVQAQQEFGAILERAQGLPRPYGGGQDVRDFVRKALDAIMRSNDAKVIKDIIDQILVYYNSFFPAIENSKKMHVPLVMPIGDAPQSSQPAPTRGGGVYVPGSGATPPDSGGGLPMFTQGNPFGFAKGGSVDTVPAMLTPGEFVLKPPAVERVSRLFGGGFLHALNSMKVPRNFFDGMFNLAPPRPLAFAGGGMVPGAQSLATGGSVRGWAGGITINITAQTVDEAEVRRSIIPALNKIMKSSR